MTSEKQTNTSASQPVHEPQGDELAVDRTAITQVGQVFTQLSNLTRNLPTPRLAATGPRSHATPAPERIMLLVAALDDPQHPEHASATDELVEIGAPAVPLLIPLLNPARPWLGAYRAAEILGYIGAGGATGPLIQALRHPNSNVRWSAIRALAQIGDLRAVFELSRMAHEDHGRTSWGESVAATAQSALDQIRTRSLWGHGVELIKTAVASAVMILAIILAFDAATSLQSEIQTLGRFDDQVAASNGVGPAAEPTPTPEDAALAPSVPTTPAEPVATATPAQEPTITPTPTPTPSLPLGQVVQGANVRPFPSVANQPLGQLAQNTQIVFVAQTPDGTWYRIRVAEENPSNSRIVNPNTDPNLEDTGWISANLLTAPDGEVPVEAVDEETFADGTATPRGTPTLTPTDLPTLVSGI